MPSRSHQFVHHRNQIVDKRSVQSFAIYLVRFACVFCIFYFGTLGIIGLSSGKNLYSPFVASYLDYITPLRHSILQSCNFLLQGLGYTTLFTDEFTLSIPNRAAVKMVYSCVGYGVLSFWTAFILANRGNVYKKIKWLLCGWVFLWSLNVLRVFLLLITIDRQNDLSFPIDHHTIYNIVAYGFIFLLMYFYDRAEKRNVSVINSL